MFMIQCPKILLNMKVQLPKTYSQNDPQWKNKSLGTSGTIGDFGCLLTDVTMTVCYFGHNETPVTLNDKLNRVGGFASGNLFVWGALSALYSDIVYQGQTQTPDPLTQGQMDDIRHIIDQKFPVFLQIDTVPATSGLDEHWILAIDYDGDDFIVQDPWDGATKRITSWGVKPQELIYAYAHYSGTPVAASTTPSQPGNTTGNSISIDKATFERLVNKSSQWDVIAGTLAIDKNDASGGQKASQRFQQLEQDINNAQLQRDDATNALNHMQGGYNSLQMQYTGLQAQYNSLQHDYLALQQNSGVPSDVMIALQKKYDDAVKTITDLQDQIAKTSAKPTTSPETNSSTKPFWESKKLIATAVTSVIPAALILVQTAQVNAGDAWQDVAIKVLGAAAASLGISMVGNQYVKAQGAIDKAAIETGQG